MDFVRALGLDTGLTAVVGAGGKKSSIYAAAAALDRAVITTTVRIPPFDDHVAELHRTADPATTLETVEEWPVGLVPAHEENRYLGYDPAVVEGIASSSVPQAVLVKADGARNRDLKAPGEDEPRIPGSADRVLGLASVQAVGEPLSESWVHRIGRVAELTGLEPGAEIGVEDVATVLSSPAGTEKGVPDSAEYLPVLNKVDDVADRAVAREIADLVLERGRADRVALTHLLGTGEPLIEVRTSS
ncbi:MAG: selenium cofactor biosynthesis protein YqeC [Halodesulfurarchaeum sp.]